MKKILVTGSNGFIGSNLINHLEKNDTYKVQTFDITNSDIELERFVINSDFIFHLAGVNRPDNDYDYRKGNTFLTGKIIRILNKNNLKTPILLTSSIQSTQDNLYGKSKRDAENLLIEYKKNGGKSYVYRLSNVFGKWCRPNYNSVVATFCHNIANDIEISIIDRKKIINFIYIDDIIDEFISVFLRNKDDSKKFYSIEPSYNITLERLADLIYCFNDIPENLIVPDLSDEFTKKLHATFLSYLPKNKFSKKLNKKNDDRGDLFEFVKSYHFGQIFVSTTKPGITRGNHYHHTKNEKFCVVRGNAEIKFRNVKENKVFSYKVSGDQPEIVDIPPGYTHSITNIGESELITLFWANEIFDSNNSDTYYEEVEK